jgi:hypothetical protein
MRLENVKFSSAGSIGTGSMPCGGKKKKKRGQWKPCGKKEKGKRRKRVKTCAAFNISSSAKKKNRQRG